jgi:phage terminase large subunit-like protein
MDDFYFDKDAADLAVKFFSKYLIHVKGKKAGEAFRLDKWQEEKIIRPLFGWKRSDGTRKYRVAYVEIPRKNGKSTLCAGLALYMLFVDREPGAEVFSAAADREQAGIVFEVAKEMVLGSPALKKRAKIYRRSIVAPRRAGSYKVLSADAYTKHGLNASTIVFDELHAQPNRDLWDVLTTSTGARTQPLVAAITTAGYDRESICWEIHNYATKILDGVIEDPTFLPVIYAADPEDDWKDPRVWAKANPGLGVSVSEEYFRQECRKAKEIPAYQNTFKRLHLNIWTEQDERWIDMDLWDRGAAPIDPKELEGRPCYGGLDLASVGDLSAFDLLFPRDDGFIDSLSFFWIPKEGARKRAERDRAPYPQWIKEGFITATEGDVTDYAVIRRDINALGKRFNIKEIGLDRWNSSYLGTQLQEDGFTLVPIGMGFASQSDPTKELMNLLLGEKFRHDGNPVLRWCASNVAVEQDAAGNLKLSKKKSTEKIDGVVSVVLALARVMKKTSVTSNYQRRGILLI